MSMIACSAAWSTCVTKSFARLERTLRPPSSEARLMSEPALRAARTAILSMGCMEGALFYSYADSDRPVPPEPPRQHWRRRARDEGDGARGSEAGGARKVSRE